MGGSKEGTVVAVECTFLVDFSSCLPSIRFRTFFGPCHHDHGAPIRSDTSSQSQTSSWIECTYSYNW